MKTEEALIDVLSSLIAAVSLLENGGKKASGSDKMFNQMIKDYKKSIDHGRKVYREIREAKNDTDSKT